jgi:hypothetical protein
MTKKRRSDVCICGHTEAQHHPTKGYCQADFKKCFCLYFEPEDWLDVRDSEEEEDDEDAQEEISNSAP